MLPLLIQRAPLVDFDLPHRSMLAGQLLRDVGAIEASIAAHGLLNPVVVTRRDGTERSMNDPRTVGRWTVVDGHKRLQAIKRLAFRGKLPRSLATIPYIVADVAADVCAGVCALEHPLSLLAPIEQVERVEELSARGLSTAAVAAALYAPESYVADIRSLAGLSPRLRNAWFGGHIDLSQARAFATLPCPDSQDALLLALGPFAGAPEIMDAVARGATVVRIGPNEEDALILPSRAHHLPTEALPLEVLPAAARAEEGPVALVQPAPRRATCARRLELAA